MAFWKDLVPDPLMVAALDEADRKGGARSTAIVAGAAQNARKNWSNAFADACARMVAAAVRGHSAFEKLTVLPNPDGNAEPPTFVAGGQTKKVDVVVSSAVSGLQVGMSLKGMNFRDRNGGQFDKNLTGRTYELQDEVRLIHEYQPGSTLVALYFMPIASTSDKKSEGTPSSFAHTVRFLRARTGRLDPTLASHHARVDLAAVALYVPGDDEPDVPYRDTLPRGVVRYFDVMREPPRRGRPKVESTMDLDGFVAWVASAFVGPGDEAQSWAEPETE